mgnify:CR=1 FL=1
MEWMYLLWTILYGFAGFLCSFVFMLSFFSNSQIIFFKLTLAILVQNDGILVIPTVQAPPPKLGTKDAMQLELQEQIMSLLSIASMSGSCQVCL